MYRQESFIGPKLGVFSFSYAYIKKSAFYEVNDFCLLKEFDTYINNITTI